MVKMTVRALMAAIALSFAWFAPRAALAQSALESTQLVVGAPAQSALGERLTVQAVLADSQGRPISKAIIYFTTQRAFLGKTSDVVLAQAVTNAQGQATAEFADDFAGPITLRAEFHGDAQYAPSEATMQTTTSGDSQTYVEHVGVDIPGFNVPPVGAPSASLASTRSGLTGLIQDLWPAMNGWPIAAVLLLVWGMYFFAVTFVFRLAASGGNSTDAAPIDKRRSL